MCQSFIQKQKSYLYNSLRELKLLEKPTNN